MSNVMIVTKTISQIKIGSSSKIINIFSLLNFAKNPKIEYSKTITDTIISPI